MERLTTNKSVADMSMIELAHNSCYADDERNARYRDYEMEMDARDFVRNLMVTLAKDELPVNDAEFDEEVLDNLTIDPFSDVRGLIALFYRSMWAMADLREKLKDYEDLGYTPEELKAAMKYVYLAKKHGTVGQVIENCVKYEAIGTPEECRAAMERQNPRAAITEKADTETTRYTCPACGMYMGWSTGLFPARYCWKCGQKLDWSDEK